MKNPLLILACVLISLISVVSRAQELVKDINTNGASLVDVSNNYSQQCFTCGNYVYFLANDAAGNELWKTDGTAAGTMRVIDLFPGSLSGIFPYESLNCRNGELYFRGSDPTSSFIIWKTDGTAAGTKKVTSITAGPTGFFFFQNKIVFTSNNNEVWITEDTPGTATLLKKIDYGDTPGTYTSILQVSTGASVYFLASVYSNFVGDRHELWKSDGTVTGTTLVKTFPFVQNEFPYGLTQIQDKVFFNANDNVSGNELWISDGTTAGTKMVTDLTPGSASLNIYINGFYNNKLIFTTSGHTWTSDGTAAGTSVMISNFNMTSFREYNGALYAIGSEPAPYRFALYKTQGTSATSEKMNSLGTDVSHLEKIPLINNKLVFAFQAPSHGVELGVSSGNLNDATLLKDINPGTSGSLMRSAAELGNQIIFIADDGTHGFELWKTDGTSEGTSLLKDVKPGTESANIENMTLLNNRLFFLAGQSTSYRNLWRSDGTSTGTELSKEFTSPFVIGQVGDYMIILDGTKFWKTNGALEETSVMWDFTSQYSSWGYGGIPSSAAGDNLYFNFSAGSNLSELWRANVKTNEVKLLKDIYPGPESSLVYSSGGAIGDLLIFAAKDPVYGEEVWITDGTESGTKLLKDISVGGNSNPRSFVSTGDKVFFTADDGVHGLQLWRTNGTSEGTVMINDIAGTLNGVLPFTPARIQNKVVFSGTTGNSSEPWISDGTPEGTHIIKKLGGTWGSLPSNFISANNKVYFTANDGERGTELAVTDGTAQGTSVIDVIPGSAGSSPSKITSAGEAVYFYANNKIWKTLGTTAITEMVAEVELLSDLYHTGNYICFIAQHPELGRELYRVEIKKFNQSITFPSIASKTLGETSFKLDATATSGLQVSLTTTNNDKIIITDSNIQLLKAGKVTIECAQPGNENFNAAAKVSQTFCINPPKPVITADVSNGAQPVLISSSAENNQWFRNDVQLSATDQNLVVTENGTYKLKTSVDGCDSEFSKTETVAITGIEDFAASIDIYPNPAVSVLYTHSPANTRFQIIDLTGSVLNEKISVVADETYNVSEIPRGSYFINVQSNGKSTTYKFIKQ